MAQGHKVKAIWVRQRQKKKKELEEIVQYNLQVNLAIFVPACLSLYFE